MHYFYREMDFRETEKPTLVWTASRCLGARRKSDVQQKVQLQALVQFVFTITFTTQYRQT